MISYEDCFADLEGTRLKDWLDALPRQVEEALNSRRHGDMPKWLTMLNALPAITPFALDFSSDCIRIGGAGDCSDELRQLIEAQLLKIRPWRKGPYQVHGLHVDTEWRSDFKWRRLSKHIAPLSGKLVLDVGCGNGYHCWRMLGEGARLVVGVDPYMIYVMQYQAIKHFTGKQPVHVLPIGIDEMPADMLRFDSVFSMGVLYHRRSPIDHLLELRGLLRSGGELVLETLVIDGGLGQVLVPEGRYAKMRNVWFIPSCATLELWLKRCGYKDIRLVDVNTTTLEEQRVTDWMEFESLADFLDPKDTSLTLEGYPAPKRAVFLATAP